MQNGTEDRHLDKAQILKFSTCKFIDDGRHIILKGAAGCGKTYIACALGNAACRKFKSVKYVRMPELLDELTIAKADGEFKKVIRSYKSVDLLILDECSGLYLSATQLVTVFRDTPSISPSVACEIFLFFIAFCIILI